MLRKLSGTKEDEITREWRRVHTEELYALYSSPNIRAIKSRRMRWAGNVVYMGTGKVYKVLVGKPEERRPLDRSRRR